MNTEFLIFLFYSLISMVANSKYKKVKKAQAAL